jgi:hypothetical protein
MSSLTFHRFQHLDRDCPGNGESSERIGKSMSNYILNELMINWFWANSKGMSNSQLSGQLQPPNSRIGKTNLKRNRHKGLVI